MGPAEHGKQYLIVCDHYFDYALKGFEMPIVLEKPIDEEDSGAIALCFDCMDLAEKEDFNHIPAGSVCTDCFEMNMAKFKKSKKTSN